MIIVDIFVPALDKTYDFKVDENEQLNVLAEQMVEMISKKEQNYIEGDVNKILVCEPDTNRILSMNRTLKELEIHTGDRLILV